jgi:arylsulfatase A-like enzyme
MPNSRKNKNYLKPRLIIALAIICSLKSCKSPKEILPNKALPNIVLINVDDLGWKDLGFMGSDYYETPHLDALAKESMVFYNAYAAAANCAPSRACMLSGLNTPRHGVYTVSPSDRGNPKTRQLIPIENTDHLSDTVYTLPQMLKSAGYVTGSFGKWHVGNDPTEQGIDVNIGGSSRGNPGNGGYFSPYKIEHISNGPDGEYLTDRLTAEAISFVEQYKDSTFFLYLPFYTVHTPIMGKEELITRFKEKKGSDGQDRPDYAAMVASMDENVGKLLATLKQTGLEKNTLVIFTSDNGGIRSISEQNPLRAGKGSYYEGGIRVPLLIKWPKHIKPNSSSMVRVSNMDFYPTLQQLVDPKKKAELLDGKDLNPIFEGKSIGETDLYFHFPIYLQEYQGLEDGSRDPLFRTRPGSVIISGDWKLHEYFEDTALELYDLKSDPGEENNVTVQNPEKTQELLKKLVDWRTATNALVPSQNNPEYDATFEQQKTKEKRDQ